MSQKQGQKMSKYYTITTTVTVEANNKKELNKALSLYWETTDIPVGSDPEDKVELA